MIGSGLVGSLIVCTKWTHHNQISLMGHPTNIFSPEPSPSCICIICHEVLELASSLKACGHTFCNNCIETSFQDSNLCPTCRVESSKYYFARDFIPNYFARDTVDELQVMCNPKAHQDDDDGNKKRKRDDDDDDVQLERAIRRSQKS